MSQVSSVPHPADRPVPGQPTAVPTELEAAIRDALSGTATERAFRAQLDVDVARTGHADDPVNALLCARLPRDAYPAVLAHRDAALRQIHAWLWSAAALTAQAVGLGDGDDGLVLLVRGACPEHGGPLRRVAVVRGDVTTAFEAETVEGTVADEVFELLREALVAARATDTGADAVVVWPARHAVATFRRRCTNPDDDGWVAGEPERLLLDLAALGLPDVDVDGWDAYDVALDEAEAGALAALGFALERAGLTGELQLGRWADSDDAGCSR